MSIENKIKKNFACILPSCGWTFDTSYKLERHVKSHTKEKPYSCKLCSKSFPNKYNLNSHVKTHEQITCNISEECSETFSSQNEYKKHIRKYHTEVRLTCPKKRCLKVFSNESDLKEHLENHDYLYLCTQCTKRFKKESLLKLHSATHSSDELKFTCSFKDCNKSFANQQRLKRHEFIHENKRQFVCNFQTCNKSFNNEDYLKTHQRTHETAKKYQCIYTNCKKYLVTAATLKVHLQTHTKDRPFKCELDSCGKTYLTASNLKAHQKLHSSGKYVKKKEPIKLLNHGLENVNCYTDLINTPLFEMGSFNDDISSIQEGVITATFGELAVNQYVNQMTNPCKITDMNSDITQFNSQLKTTDAFKNSFQDELISTVYSMLDKNVLSGHDYNQPLGNHQNYDNNIMLQSSVTSNNIFITNATHESEEHLLESSMELCTGHLVIDSGELSPYSCMPDHVYSNNQTYNKSTINLDDLR